MILLPFFASSTAYGSTKNLLSLPFQAQVFFVLSFPAKLIRYLFCQSIDRRVNDLEGKSHYKKSNNQLHGQPFKIGFKFAIASNLYYSQVL